MIGDRWGVTDDEVARHYPCDDIVAAPVLQAWRAGYGRGWRRSGSRRTPMTGSTTSGVAHRASYAPCPHLLLCILSIATPEQLTGQIAGAVISYVLVPKGDSTRLLMKIVTARGRLVAPLLSVGDLVMARRQLLNLKQLAEQRDCPA